MLLCVRVVNLVSMAMFYVYLGKYAAQSQKNVATQFLSFYVEVSLNVVFAYVLVALNLLGGGQLLLVLLDHSSR